MSIVGGNESGVTGPLCLRARWVVPIEGPPLENGEVVVEQDRIVAVRPVSGVRSNAGSSKRGEGVRDFGQAALLPGLVNVHSHLQYTVFRGFLDDLPFFPWIRTLTALKSCLDPDDWLASATLGAAEMVAAGVTCVGDCADAADAVIDALAVTGLRGTVFREVFGIAPPPLHEPGNDEAVLLAEFEADLCTMAGRIGTNDAAGRRIHIGLSPHAPFTVRRDLFGPLAALAARHNVRQAIHVAETRAEDDLIRHGTGPFAAMFARRDIPWTPADVSPVRYLADAGAFAAAPTLAVHCVHVDHDDAALLASQGVAVAHCPKSNGKLGAGSAPLRTLLDAGLSVGLGTDSVASNNAVDLWEEMRAALYLARANAGDAATLGARDVLSMATLGGARALGKEAEIGSLTPGKRADLCVMDLRGLHLFPVCEDDPVAALVYGARASDTLATMVDGRMVYERAPGSNDPAEAAGASLVDVDALRARIVPARQRLRRRVAAEQQQATRENGIGA